jgi:hypothetical protein
MMPISRIAAISSEVAIGRRMNGRDGFIPLGAGGVAAPAGAAAGACRSTIFEPFCSLSKPSVTSLSPGLTPVTAEVSPSVARIFTSRDCDGAVGLHDVDEGASLLR